MLLCRAVEGEFTPTDRRSGNVLERHARIVGLIPSGQRVRATVREGGSFTVEVDWSAIQAGLIGVRCSCTRSTTTVACRHVWAVLCAIDNSRRIAASVPRFVTLRALDQVAGTSTQHLPAAAAATDDYDDATTTTGTGLTRADAGDWRELARICRHGPPEPGRGEIAQPLAKRRYWWVMIPPTLPGQESFKVYSVAQTHRQTGGWGAPQVQLPVHGGAYDGDLTLDMELLRRLREATRDRYSYAGFGYRRYSGAGYGQYGSSGAFKVDVSVAPDLLQLLCQHDRFIWLWDIDQPLEDGRRVDWDNGPAYRFSLRSVWDPGADGWTVEGVLCRGDEPTVPISAAVAFLAQRFVLFADRLAPLQMPPVPAIVDWFRAKQSVFVAARERVSFLKSLISAVDPESVRALSVELVGELVDGGMEPELHIDPDQCRGKSLAASVQFAYADIVLPTSGPHVTYSGERGRVVIRDRAAERQALAALHEQLAPARGYRFEGQSLIFDYRMLPALVRALIPLGWQVRVSGQRVRWPGAATFSVQSDIDWFDVDGKIDFDGTPVPLPQLLHAVKSGDSMITLDDGTRGMIPEDWLERYGRLLQLGEVQDDVIRFQGSQVLVLDALLAEQDTVDVDATFRRIRRRLREFEGVREVRAPRGFRGQLRPYQRCGLGWLRFLRRFDLGGCLADDMGLGKTVQVLALLQSRRARRLRDGEIRKPSLVVVPKSLVFNWIDEAARFAPRLRVLDFTGVDRHQFREALAEYDVVITTYGTLRRDIATIREMAFDYAILDEATAIKNSNSQNAKACRLLQADHRLAMTGTPIENHLGELWSLLEFLNPGMLGSLTAFQSLTDKSASTEQVKWLAQAIGPFVLRRTKEQVIKELPPKTEKTIRCEMSAKERAAYDELRHYYQRQLSQKIKEKGLNRSKIHVLEALLRLRQAACHPALLDPDRIREPSAKLDAFLERLDEVVNEGHKVLVFSQFTTFLGIVRDRLDRAAIPYEYLDGKTRDRKGCVERFQSDDQCPVFLISLKAGGHGLNLTAADYVFILDPWWNPAVEAQAVDRTHRIGQRRPVFAYRFVARHTVEDKVLQLQEQKRELAEAIITANESLIRRMTAEDLQLLLG